MIISLIGYRGTGKSSVAPLLAEKLGWSWSDLDELIERQAGRPIREIFADGGEPLFRKFEKQTLFEQLKLSNRVLATGGGVILDPESRAAIAAAGPVVWLTAEVDLIVERMNVDPTSPGRRPRLTDHDPREEVVSLLTAREPLYRACATLTYATDHATVEELAEDIFDAVRGQLS